MPHELIALSTMPTIPMAYSSKATRGAGLWMYYSDDYYSVIDEQPISMEQSMKLVATGKLDRNYDMQYLFAASLFYRPSRNPHGPSKRPIFVAALEHSPFSCEYEKPGCLGGILGMKRKPKTVFLGLFTASGHENFGERPNRFTVDNARAVLLETVSARVGLNASDFKPCANPSRGPECPEIA